MTQATRQKRFKRAQRNQIPVRLFLMGRSKGGKSRSALQIGQHLAMLRAAQGQGNGRLACIESELVGEGDAAASRLTMYLGEACECEQCRGRDMVLDFDLITLDEHHRNPKDYSDALQDAAGERYAVVVVDSIFHGWKAILSWVDKLKAQNRSHDPWLKATPVYRDWIERMLTFPGDLIACSRVKTEYDRNVQKGQSYINLGDIPDFRKGIEYEFDHAFYMADATAVGIGSRASQFQDATYTRPGLRLAHELLTWSNRGIRPRSTARQQAPVSPASEGGRAVESGKRPAPVRPPRVEPKRQPEDCKHPAWSAVKIDGVNGTRCEACHLFREDEAPPEEPMRDLETCKHPSWSAAIDHRGDVAIVGAACDDCATFRADETPPPEDEITPSEQIDVTVSDSIDVMDNVSVSVEPTPPEPDGKPCVHASITDKICNACGAKVDEPDTKKPPGLVELVEEITAGIKGLSTENAEKANGWLKRAGTDTKKLMQTRDWVNANQPAPAAS